MQLQVVVSAIPEANSAGIAACDPIEQALKTDTRIGMEVGNSLTPEVYDPQLSDMLDLNHLVTYFAEAGGAFVYPLSPESDVLIVSPRPLEHRERKQVYTKHLIETLELMTEDSVCTPEDIRGRFLFPNGEPLTDEEIRDIEMELAKTPTKPSVACDPQFALDFSGDRRENVSAA